MNIQYIPCNSANYGSSRSTGNIKYIVIHYTANNGDSALGNGNYFKNNDIGASAHYFVDSNNIVQSVKDNHVAWSVGGSKYNNCSITGGGKYYGKCTNNNSLSIELADDTKDGRIYPSAATINNAVALTKELMAKYNIPASNVIRHFDVTGKSCPAYWCGDSTKNNLWLTEFWNKLTTTNKTEVDDEVISEGKANVNGKEYKIDRILKDGTNFIKAANFSNMGFDVGYDANTKAVTINNKIDNITVNEKNVEAVNIKGYNYVKLRDIAEVLGKDVETANGKITIK